MRNNGYTIDENDVFHIKPIETDSEEEYSQGNHICPVDLIGDGVDSEEDWD